MLKRILHFLWTGNLLAESERAKRLYHDSKRLLDEGSYESLQQALGKLNEALPLFRFSRDRRGIALTLDRIGLVHFECGDVRTALYYFQQAFAVVDGRRFLRDVAAAVLSSIALTYSHLGHYDAALNYYESSLRISRRRKDYNGEASALNGIAQIHQRRGESQKALDCYQQGLSLRRRTSNRRAEGINLSNIGMVYFYLGETGQALSYYTQALTLARSCKYRRLEASILNNIGMIFLASDRGKETLDFFEQVFSLFHAAGDRNGTATVLYNMGFIYEANGETQEALEYYHRALARYHDLGERITQAAVLKSIAGAHYLLGNVPLARQHYEQALEIYRQVNNFGGEAETLAEIGQLELDQGQVAEARKHAQDAIAITETLREQIGSNELRASYLATAQSRYGLLIEILMNLHAQLPADGHDGEALYINERAHARALLDTLVESRVDLEHDADPALSALERSLRQQINSLGQRRLILSNGDHADQAYEISQKIETLRAEIEQVKVEIRKKNPHCAALTQPQPLSLAEIQTQVLDENTLLLEYSLGDEHSYLWAVTPTWINSYELPKRSEIEDVARRAYELLNARNENVDGESMAQRRRRIREADEEYVIVAARLTEMVLAPAWEHLSSKRLLIVSEGALQYIPFGALPIPQGQAGSDQAPAVDVHSLNPPPPNPRPLILDHEIVSVPSASTIAVLRRELEDRPLAEKTVMIFADPVFESCDERAQPRRRTKNLVKWPWTKGNDVALDTTTSAQSASASGNFQFKRLYGTRKEAEQILSFLTPGQGRAAFDFAASLEAATDPELAQYRYLHFATHGILDSTYPELSGVVLSLVDEDGQPRDGFLRGHEVFNLKLAAELVTLSACQTGLGKEVKGEGLVGLTRGFMYAGAPRVVVSLWEVDDESTAELMARFYRGMLKEQLRPAAALRAAQISLFKESGWTAPYYWAAFILQGEWR